MTRPTPSLAAWLVLISLLFLSGLPALAASAPDDLAAYADRLLAEAYPADEPGAAALVTRNGQIVLRKGYGLADPELSVPIRPDMVFQIGSVTKQFTAVGILMLAERGLLSVEDDITRHLPDYPTHGQKITIEHLLTHTSGIPSYTNLDEDWLPRVREDLKVQELIDIFKDKPLDFAPGERWAYNNSAYVLLGAVIEKLTGKAYEDFVEQEILAPAGMTASRYGSNEEIVPGRMDGYDKNAKGYHRAPYLSWTHPYSAGALLSTVDDLARWADALSTGKLLKSASTARMTAPGKLTSGIPTHYGYGVGISEYAGRTIVEHGGNTFGFAADLLRVPEEGLVVVILSNDNSKDPEPVALKIAARALGQPLEDRPVLTLDAKALDEYVGVYRFSDKVTRTITREGDRLFAQRSRGDKLEILPLGRDRFGYRDSATVLRIRRDARGKIEGAEAEPRFGPTEIGVRTDEPIPSQRKAVKVDPALFDAYVGVYELKPGFSLAVTREGDRLFVQPTDQPKLELFPESETKFFLREVDAQLVFVRGEGGDRGRVETAILHQGGREVPGKRVK